MALARNPYLKIEPEVRSFLYCAGLALAGWTFRPMIKRDAAFQKEISIK
jgi:hypothetical protein